MKYTKGATLLLRDSLPAPSPLPSASSPYSPPGEDSTSHVAETNHRASVYESVGSYLFSFSAGAFFQNNNSILIPLTDYVREAIFPSGPTVSAIPNGTSLAPTSDNDISSDKTGTEINTNTNTHTVSGNTSTPKPPPPPTHLVDTYCGSGLFGITLSSGFERVAGVEISEQSIAAAKINAEMNGLQEKTEWLCGKAENIFGGLEGKGFRGDRSCVVVDVSNVLCLFMRCSGRDLRVFHRATTCSSHPLFFDSGTERILDLRIFPSITHLNLCQTRRHESK